MLSERWGYSRWPLWVCPAHHPKLTSNPTPKEYPFGGMVIFADEIYDQITFDGKKMTHLVRPTYLHSHPHP